MKPAIHSPDRRRLAKSIVVSLYFTLVLAAASPVISAPAAVPGRILVKPHPAIAEAQLHGLFRQHNAVQVDQISAINVRILNVPEAAQDHVKAALSHDPNIEFAESDEILAPDFVPNDPSYINEWHLTKIRAPQAWDITRGSSSVIIAILDTGVDATHPDLAPNLVPGWNFYDNNSDTSDVYGHGTAVAGTAAAAGNNATGVASVAFNCRFMPIRVSDLNGYGSYSAMASGLTYAADHGARVANISYKVTTSSTVTSAAQYFQSKGGVTTVSAGNEGTFDSTQDNPYVLTVSATGTDDAIMSWSCTGNNIDLAAPGTGIWTTTRDGGYGGGTGTSFSAPIVAGAAALVISANPSLSGSQVQDILKQSADDLGATGWDSIFGWGRLNAYKAVLAAVGQTQTDTVAPTATVNAPAAGSILSGTVSIVVSASDNVGVTQLECYLNGALVAKTTATTLTLSWNTAGRTNGSYSLQARAYDAAGNVGTSPTINVQVQNTSADSTAPAVQVTSPAAGSTVSGVASVNVSATDNVGVTKVEWYINGASAGSSATAPASFSWNTTAYLNGSYSLQARAYDAAGNVGTSATVTVSVQNNVADLTLPTVQITSPTAGTTVSGNASVNVSATDNVGVTKVEWYLNGVSAGTSTSATATFSWNTMTCPNGSCTLQARAYDGAGNVGISPPVTVSVNNLASSPDLVPPTVQITSPNSGVSVVKNTKVYVASSDNVATTRVDLLVDGKLYSTSSLATSVFSWNTSKISHGSHTLQAVAYDAAGNYTRSSPVTVYK